MSISNCCYFCALTFVRFSLSIAFLLILLKAQYSTYILKIRLFNLSYFNRVASWVTQLVKNPPAMQKTWVQSLDWEDSLEKGMVSDSSSLAWGFPWTKETGRLQSMGAQRVRHDRLTNTFTFLLEYRMSEIGYHCEKYGLLTMNTRNGLPLV